MEHFKRLAFCMLYLFTFIWQLSAQVKKIPQWGAVRDSVGQSENSVAILLSGYSFVSLRHETMASITDSIS